MQIYGGNLSVARNMNVAWIISNNRKQFKRKQYGGSMSLFDTFTGTGRDLTIGMRNGGNMLLYGAALSVDNNGRIYLQQVVIPQQTAQILILATIFMYSYSNS